MGAERSQWPKLLLRVGATAGAVTGLLILVMVVVESFGPAFINEPSTWRADATLLIAALSVLLLASDVVLPIPSSVVLVANGTVFGVAVGSAVSTLGLVASALLGYGLGRRGAQVTMRFVGSASMDWLIGCVERHGIWIVGASRAVPLASEITALGAGASGMRRGPFVAAAIVGAAAASIPMALVGAGTFGGGGAAVVWMSAVAAGVTLWIGARLWAAARPPVDRRDIDLAGA